MANDADKNAAVEEAMAYMESICGNAGQREIIKDGETAFDKWADAIWNGDPAPIGGVMMSAMGPDKYRATDAIWEEGAIVVEEAAAQESLSNAVEGVLGAIGDFIGMIRDLWDASS